MFSQVIEDSDDFARYSVLILTINGVGVAVLIALIGNRLVRLVRDYRRYVPGSRLQARVVSLIGIVAAVPLVVLYLFAVAFIARGIDEWFTDDIGQGLDDALELTNAAIAEWQSDSVDQLVIIAGGLRDVDAASVEPALAEIGRAIDVLELSLFSSGGARLATYASRPDAGQPAGLSPEMLGELPYVGLEFSVDSAFYDEIVVAVGVETPSRERQILRGRFEVPPLIQELANRIDSRQGAFARLALLRTDLKLSLALILSLVLLIAVLGAVYTAFFVSQRLIGPIQRLMQGTRAVARGRSRSRARKPATPSSGSRKSATSSRSSLPISRRASSRSSRTSRSERRTRRPARSWSSTSRRMSAIRSSISPIRGRCSESSWMRPPSISSAAGPSGASTSRCAASAAIASSSAPAASCRARARTARATYSCSTTSLC
jgi:nitrogen fixation/metabolism regulation signal transduction histidine kinase